MSHHFNRVFHAREGAPRVAPHHPRGRRRALPYAVLRGSPYLQPAADRSVPCAADLAGQIDRELALDPRHGRLLRPGHLPGKTSATTGGLDSLLEPTGPLREAQQLAAETFGSRQTYFVTNGTSTANKIVAQALLAPGDIVLVDRNCHQSHHYGLMLAGAEVTYLDAYPLNEYSMYGAVPLREIKSKLLALRAAGKLDRVRLLMLTNCTFDGIVYDVGRVMEECLAIKPDLVFLWDEAWFAFARFHHVYRPRTAMEAARTLAEVRSPRYRARYEADLPTTRAMKRCSSTT